MAVTSNSGTNYTLYYNVLEYFRTIMVNHPSLFSVSQGSIEDVDGEAYPVYPIGNVLISNTKFTPNETIFTIQLTIADKVKLRNNESEGRPNSLITQFYGVDDSVDIFSNTLGIANDLTAYTQRSQQAFIIDTDIELTPFKDDFDNGLCGWLVTFDLKTHNNRDMCLFNLNP